MNWWSWSLCLPLQKQLKGSGCQTDTDRVTGTQRGQCVSGYVGSGLMSSRKADNMPRGMIPETQRTVDNKKGRTDK